MHSNTNFESDFRAYDANKDGKIVSEELHSFIQLLDGPLFSNEFAPLLGNFIASVDEDGDNSINLSEFRTLVSLGHSFESQIIRFMKTNAGKKESYFTDGLHQWCSEDHCDHPKLL